MGDVTPLRRWIKSLDGYVYMSGTKALGYVLTTDYGTVCWGGKGLRGTAETVEFAKLCVESIFTTDDSMVRMLERCQEGVNRKATALTPPTHGDKNG